MGWRAGPSQVETVLNRARKVCDAENGKGVAPDSFETFPCNPVGTHSRSLPLSVLALSFLPSRRPLPSEPLSPLTLPLHIRAAGEGKSC